MTLRGGAGHRPRASRRAAPGPGEHPLPGEPIGVAPDGSLGYAERACGLAHAEVPASDHQFEERIPALTAGYRRHRRLLPAAVTAAGARCRLITKVIKRLSSPGGVRDRTRLRKHEKLKR